MTRPAPIDASMNGRRRGFVHRQPVNSGRRQPYTEPLECRPRSLGVGMPDRVPAAGAGGFDVGQQVIDEDRGPGLELEPAFGLSLIHI
mgnify:CR=1 FL=1